MKTIGLLGGTSYSSTITYYRLLNELVHERLGGDHSAKIILKSIDHHDICIHFGKDHDKLAKILQFELIDLIAFKPDCIIICCNILHKYYDMIKGRLCSDIPVFHALELVAAQITRQHYKKVLLLATKNTMEDGFFAKKLEGCGIEVTIPNEKERDEIHKIHEELKQDIVTQEARDYFKRLVTTYKHLDAVVLGCTELPLAVNKDNSLLPLIDPINLQATAAVGYVLG